MANNSQKLPFAERLVTWQRLEGRHDLPWQNTQDPYRVWVSEIMLQQTQVSAVKGYYQRFMNAFPTVEHLAAATEEDVLALWSGLGYYSRGRNLHKAAQKIVNEWKGVFSTLPEDWIELSGVGRSTAAAITSFCFNTQAAILDGNVKRVLSRHAGIAGFPGERLIELQLWDEAVKRLPANPEDMPAYTQGLMDLGATLCVRKKPDCAKCPVNEDCIAFLTHRTDEIPAPKPRKVIPERQLNVLSIIRDHHILLEYRERDGVWKGLWSLPETDIALKEPHLQKHIENWGLNISHFTKGILFTHTFSHYRLHLHPWLIHADQGLQESLPTGYQWKAFQDLPSLGLPAPIRKFLENKFSPDSNENLSIFM